MEFDREKLGQKLAELAGKGVYIGTSSWKYPGWRGMIYDESKYITRGKFAESRFERDCLTEYAEVFKTVCVDAGYYRFPEQRYIEKLVTQVPSDFLFTFKVTDEITIKKFPNQPRHGIKAGKPNEHFLNADLFARAFVKPFEPFKQNVGMFIFEAGGLFHRPLRTCLNAVQIFSESSRRHALRDGFNFIVREPIGRPPFSKFRCLGFWQLIPSKIYNPNASR